MFGVYVTLDDRNVLDAQKVFVSMALINILKTPLSQLPFAISTTMQVCDILIMYSCWLCDIFPIYRVWWGIFSWSHKMPIGRLANHCLCSRLWFHWDVWESTCAQKNWKWTMSQRLHWVLVRIPPMYELLLWMNKLQYCLISPISIICSPCRLKLWAVIIDTSSPQNVVVYICGGPKPCMDDVHCHFLGLRLTGRQGNYGMFPFSGWT